MAQRTRAVPDVLFHVAGKVAATTFPVRLSMSLRRLVVVVVVLAALGLAWQKREPLQAWLGAAPALSALAPSLSEPLVPARPATDAANPAVPKSGPGGLRKCVKGQQVSYTNVECPPGHQEQAVTAAPVTVLPATPVSRPAESGDGPSSLHKALDLTRDDTLRERAIERAVNGSR